MADQLASRHESAETMALGNVDVIAKTADRPKTSSPTAVHTNAMEAAMGGIIEQVQKGLGAPPQSKTSSSEKPVVKLQYAFAAQATLQLDTEWKIVEGLVLRRVMLKTNVEKATGMPAALGVELSAIATLAGIAVRVSGVIPKLQENHDTEFQLNIEACSTLQRLSFMKVLADCDKMAGKANPDNKPISSIGNLLLGSGHSVSDVDFGAKLSITVVKNHKTDTYSLKTFRLDASAALDWQLPTGSKDFNVRLRKAAISLHITRAVTDSSDSSAFNGHLAIKGSLLLGKSTAVEAAGKLTVEKGDLSLALSCDVDANAGCSPEQLLNHFGGPQCASLIEARNPLPPDLSVSTHVASPSTTHQHSLEKPPQFPSFSGLAFRAFVSVHKPANESWRLQQMHTAIHWPILWSPFPNIIIDDLSILLAAERAKVKTDGHAGQKTVDERAGKASSHHDFNTATTPAPGHSSSKGKDNPTASDELQYEAVVQGKLTISKIAAVVTARYSTSPSALTLDFSIGDVGMTSLANIITAPMFKELHGDTAYTENDLHQQAQKDKAWPASCPLDLEQTLSSPLGRDKHCSIVVRDGKVSSLGLRCTFSYYGLEWKLLDSLEMGTIGVLLNMERSKKPKERASIHGILHGHFKLKSGRDIYGIVAGTRDKSGGQFLLHLSTTPGPDKRAGGSGTSLTDLAKESEFNALVNPDTKDCKLPSSVSTAVKPEDVLGSTLAAITLKLQETELEAAKPSIKNKAHEASDNHTGSETDLEEDPKYKTSLVFVMASLNISGIWNIFSGLHAKSLSLHVLVAPKNAEMKTPSTTYVELRGKLEVAAHSIYVVTTFNKTDDLSKFKARLVSAAGDTEATDPLKISPTDVLALEPFGGKAIDTSSESIALPSGYPSNASDIVKAPEVECELEVTGHKSGTTTSWELTKLFFHIPSISEWIVIKDTLIVESSSLRLIVDSPKAAKRHISLDAKAMIRIGSSTRLVGHLTFDQAPGKVRMLHLDLKAQWADLKNIVQSVAKQNLDDLIPKETPKVEADAYLQVKLSIALADDKAKHCAQSIKVIFDPKKTMELDMFKIGRLYFVLDSLSSSKAAAITVQFHGEIICKDVPAGIHLLYRRGTTRQMAFNITARKSQILTADKLSSLDGLHVPHADLPDNRTIDFGALPAADISGTLRLASGPADKPFLQHLEVYVHSKEQLEVLKLDDTHVNLERIYLHWIYNRRSAAEKPDSQGHISAHLSLVKLGKPQADMEVDIVRDDKDFKISGKFSRKAVQHSDILDRFLPSTAYTNPPEIKAPSTFSLLSVTVTIIMGKSIEVSASGNDQWTIPVGDLKLHLEKAGIDFGAEKPSKDANWAYHVFLSGKVAIFGKEPAPGKPTISSFKSAAAARARLSISWGLRDAYLSALVQKTPAVGDDDIKTLGDSQGDDKWTALVPTERPITFGPTDIMFLYIEFKTGLILLAGKSHTLGSAFFLSRKNQDKDKSGRSYIVKLSINDLSTLFPFLKDGIMSTLELGQAELSVMSYEGTPHSLSEDLKLPAERLTDLQLADGTSPLELEVIEEVKRTDTAPLISAIIPLTDEKAKLAKGTWVFTEIRFKDTSTAEMSKTLSFCSSDAKVGDHQSKAKVYLYGLLSRDSQIYGVIAKEFTLLGGSVIFEGSGSIVTQKVEEKTHWKISLEAKLAIDGFSGSGRVEGRNVRITVEKGTMTYAMNPSHPLGTIHDPFGDMFNVQLSVETFYGILEHGKDGKMKHTATFRGKAAIGPHDQTFDLVTTVQLLGGSPQLVLIEFPKLEFTKIFQRILGTDGGLKELPELTLTNGQLYYAKARTEVQIDSKPVVYEDGYHARASVTVCGCVITGCLDLPPREKATTGGVTFKGTNEGVVDLPMDFMRLKNPTVTIKTSEKHIEISTDAEFFGDGGYELSLQYQHKDPKRLTSKSGLFRGKIQREKAEISVLYRDGCFGVDGWDMGSILGAEYKDLVKAIGEATQAEKKGDPKYPKKCEDLVDLMFKSAVKTEFHFHLAAPDEGTKLYEPDKKRLNGQLKWHYDILLLSHKILGIELPSIAVHLTGPFSMNDLPAWFGEQIKSNGVAIGRAILSRPEELAEVVAIMMVDKLKKEVIKALLCRKIDDKGGKIRRKGIETGFDDKHNGDDKYKTLKEVGKKIWNFLKTLAKVALVVAAVISLVALAAELAVVAAEVWAFIRSARSIIALLKDLPKVREALQKLLSSKAIQSVLSNLVKAGTLSVAAAEIDIEPGILASDAMAPMATPSAVASSSAASTSEGPAVVTDLAGIPSTGIGFILNGTTEMSAQAFKSVLSGVNDTAVPDWLMDLLQLESGLVELEANFKAESDKAQARMDQAKKELMQHFAPTSAPKLELIVPKTESGEDVFKIDWNGTLPDVMVKEAKALEGYHFEIRISTTSDPEAAGALKLAALATDTAVTAPTARFRDVKVVHAWVRISIKIQDTVFEGQWSPAASLDFVPRLPSPQAVHFSSPAPGKGTATADAHLKVASKGTYQVCIVSAHEPMDNVIMHRTVELSGAQEPELVAFSLVELSGRVRDKHSALRVLAWQVSKDARLARDSLMSLSTSSLRIIRGIHIPDLRSVEETGNSYRLTWTLPDVVRGEDVGFDLVLLDENNARCDIQQSALSKNGSSRSITVQLSSKREGAMVCMRIHPHEVEPNAIYLFKGFRTVLGAPPAIEIMSSSFYDVVDDTAYLYLRSTVSLAPQDGFAMYVHLVENHNPDGQIPKHTTSADVGWVGADGKACRIVQRGLKQHLDASQASLWVYITLKKANQRWFDDMRVSNIWALPDRSTRDSASARNPPECFFRWTREGLTIRWKKKHYPEFVFGSGEVTQIVDTALDFERRMDHFLVRMETLTGYISGGTVFLLLAAGSGNAHGQKRHYVIRVPSPSYNLTILLVRSDWYGSKYGALTALPSDSPAAKSTMEFFGWGSTSSDYSYGPRFRALSINTGKEYNIDYSKPPPSGSGAASLTRNADHREIFYIGPDGSVEGAYWYRNDNRWQVYTHALNGHRALTMDGGSITAASDPSTPEDRSRMDIWYISATGGLCHLCWLPKHGGWQAVHDYTPGMDTNKPAYYTLVSPLVSLATPGTLRVYWISAMNNLHYLYGSADPDRAGMSWTHTIARDSASPSGGLAAYTNDTHNFVFFLSWEGGVFCAKQSARGPPDGSWTKLQIAPIKSAHAQSGIAVVPGKREAFTVVWFNQKGHAVAAIPQKEEPGWVTMELHQDMWTRLPTDEQDLGKLEMVVLPRDKGSRDVAYVGRDNKIYRMPVICEDYEVSH